MCGVAHWVYVLCYTPYVGVCVFYTPCVGICVVMCIVCMCMCGDWFSGSLQVVGGTLKQHAFLEVVSELLDRISPRNISNGANDTSIPVIMQKL